MISDMLEILFETIIFPNMISKKTHPCKKISYHFSGNEIKLHFVCLCDLLISKTRSKTITIITALAISAAFVFKKEK